MKIDKFKTNERTDELRLVPVGAKNGLRIACLTFETVVFTFYYLNPFFQVAGTQHYLGIGLYSVPITLFADGRVDFTYG